MSEIQSQQMPRHAIGKFTHFGEQRDCTGQGFEIDDHFQVFKNGKLLATNRGNSVDLCAGAGDKKQYTVVRLYLSVVYPLRKHVEECSGIRVVDHSLPKNDPGRYAWETPADRDELVRQNDENLASDSEIWTTGEHNDEVFGMYEIEKATSMLRNKKTKIIIKPTTNGQVSLVSSDGTRVMIRVHRMWMFTYVKERREDQVEVDHINGDHTDNRPQNLRWASPSENRMYIFKAPVKASKGIPFAGNRDKLKRFEDSEWYFGIVDGEFVVVDRDRQRRISDFNWTDRHPYPTIMGYQAHRVVLYVYGRMTRDQFYNPPKGEVVEHLDNHTWNFHPDNLKYGSGSSNQIARHSNPETSSRVRVQQFKDGKFVAEYESQAAATRAVGGDQGGVSQAIAKGCKHKEFHWKLA